MDAVVSGRAGRALIIDGRVLKSLEVDDPSTLIPRSQADLPFLLGEARDLRVLENTSIESIERELRAQCDLTLALDLFLISLDAELESDIRNEALEGLEELLRNSATAEQLENILFSSPLPEDADLAGALELSETQAPALTLQFLQRLEAHQPSITKVDRAWQSIPIKHFNNSYELGVRFRQVVVKEGLFRILATNVSAASFATFLLKAGLNRSIQALPNHRQVIQAWVNPFRHSRETRRIVKEDDDGILEPDRFDRRGRIDVRAVLQETNRRKSVIVQAMHRRDFARVDNLVDDLVAYQQSNSASQHTAKSLCDLAMEAKALGMYSLQLALTERSVNIAPGDSWSWRQHADALLKMQRLDEALKASDQAIAFRGGAVAKAVRGEILKAKGQFEDALAAFDEAIKEDADGSSFAKNGRAEVLKAQGRFDDALDAYDDIISRHPENVVAKTGRAEVLKAQGQFEVALLAYEEVIDQHPDDVVAKTGRAEVLKAQGQFEAALLAYEEVIDQHPDDVVVKNGRAEVLKAQGQFEAAILAYDEVIDQHPDDVVAKNGRAEVLKAQGQFEAAMLAYDEVIGQHPDDVVAKNGRAEVLKAQGQFEAALAAYEEVISQHPENVVAKTGRAEVLKAQGQFEAALAAYEEVINQHHENPVAKTGRAEVLKAQGQFKAALAAYEEVINQHPEDVVAKNGRAEVLKAQGQFEAALAAYEEVIYQHPENAVARNGRSCVLVALHRYEEALYSLPTNAPVALESWIAYHIRGMTLLRLGRLSEAIRIFDDGLRNVPFPSEKEYFRGALGLAWLRGREFKKAGEALESLTSPVLQASANVIRIHAFGAQGEHDRAVHAYENLTTTPYLLNDELTQELHHQYVLGGQPRKDDEWVFDREVTMFLRVA